MTILEEAQKIVDGDRAKEYGDMRESFTQIAAFWSAYLDVDIDTLDVAKMMMLLKISRARNSNGRDSYVDIAGYVACADKLMRDDCDGVQGCSSSDDYISLKRMGDNWVILCPFHKEETPALVIYLYEDRYYCYGCGEKGDMATLCAKLIRLGLIDEDN